MAVAIYTMSHCLYTFILTDSEDLLCSLTILNVQVPVDVSTKFLIEIKWGTLEVQTRIGHGYVYVC